MSTENKDPLGTAYGEYRQFVAEVDDVFRPSLHARAYAIAAAAGTLIGATFIWPPALFARPVDLPPEPTDKMFVLQSGSNTEVLDFDSTGAHVRSYALGTAELGLPVMAFYVGEHLYGAYDSSVLPVGSTPKTDEAAAVTLSEPKCTDAGQIIVRARVQTSSENIDTTVVADDSCTSAGNGAAWQLPSSSEPTLYLQGVLYFVESAA